MATHEWSYFKEKTYMLQSMCMAPFLLCHSLLLCLSNCLSWDVCYKGRLIISMTLREKDQETEYWYRDAQNTCLYFIKLNKHFIYFSLLSLIKYSTTCHENNIYCAPTVTGKKAKGCFLNKWSAERIVCRATAVCPGQCPGILGRP